MGNNERKKIEVWREKNETNAWKIKDALINTYQKYVTNFFFRVCFISFHSVLLLWGLARVRHFHFSFDIQTIATTTTKSPQMRIIAKVHATHSKALNARRLPFEPWPISLAKPRYGVLRNGTSFDSYFFLAHFLPLSLSLFRHSHFVFGKNESPQDISYSYPL